MHTLLNTLPNTTPIINSTPFPDSRTLLITTLPNPAHPQTHPQTHPHAPTNAPSRTHKHTLTHPQTHPHVPTNTPSHTHKHTLTHPQTRPHAPAAVLTGGGVGKVAYIRGFEEWANAGAFVSFPRHWLVSTALYGMAMILTDSTLQPRHFARTLVASTPTWIFFIIQIFSNMRSHMSLAVLALVASSVLSAR